MAISWIVKAETRQNIDEMRRLLASGVIDKDVADAIFWAVLTRMFILAHITVIRSAKYAGKAISFSDDVIISGRVHNVADLIRYARDAFCHTESNNHDFLGGLGITNWCAKRGKGELFPHNPIGFSFACEYKNDTAIFIGDQRVHLRRHLIVSVR